MVSKFQKIILVIGALSLAALLIVGCARSKAETAAPHSSMSTQVATADSQSTTPNQIVIKNFAFAPATLTVKAGTKVTWVNRDDDPHTVDQTDKLFKSGTMDTDGQYSYTFTSPGTFKYFCALHPRMVGQIVVQ
ncbi:MAG TPA: cupredoxin family copper-binding protein [Pyrinomonadaceae bacterium]|nr:cupredoxin family copper-binding protein [Pyrinomonadaceae bacterium]